MPKPTEVNSTPEDLEARVASEQLRLEAEERHETELTAQRAAPLAAGDDDALDAIEVKIDRSRSAQLRIKERIEVLEAQLCDARATAKVAEAQRWSMHAAHLQEQAEIAAREYDVHALAAAAALSHVAAVDAALERVNRHLRSLGYGGAGRGSIVLRHGPNTRVPESRRRETRQRGAMVGHGVGHGITFDGMPVRCGQVGGDPNKPDMETVEIVTPAHTVIGPRFPEIAKIAVIPGATYHPASHWTPKHRPDPAEVERLAKLPKDVKGEVT